ncbi:hypothetical protein [Undibacterium sp. WLX3042]|uniref:hypothetical protein n=1 Tax=Undibacterium sp. WLX3042 TaxID=3412686 RepID=UPI003C2C1A3E
MKLPPKPRAIESKHFMDKVTGKTYRFYTYKRRRCRRVELKSRIVDQLAGYTLIEKDLRSVSIWLEEIERLHTDGPKGKDESYCASPDREKYNIVKGLFVAALTFYGKCFTKCEGRPVKLERAQIDIEFHEIFDRCIGLRHNFAAHSGSEKIEHVEVALVFPEKSKSTSQCEIFRELHQPDLYWPLPPDKTLMELVTHTREKAQAKIDKLIEKIMKEDVAVNYRKYGLVP